MGYTTEFKGTFKLDKPLADEHFYYLRAFADIRHVQRDAGAAAALPDPIRVAAGLAVGEEGAYFVGGSEYRGQGADASVRNDNKPPTGAPGLWCQWTPTADRCGIAWDEGEKFYEYVKWIKFIVAHFLKPWGYVLNGEVEWQGEDDTDTGVIDIKNNSVSAYKPLVQRLADAGRG